MKVQPILGAESSDRAGYEYTHGSPPLTGTRGLSPSLPPYSLHLLIGVLFHLLALQALQALQLPPPQGIGGRDGATVRTTAAPRAARVAQ